MEKAGINDRVLIQVFQKKGGLLCGVDEILAILRLCSGYYSDLEEAYRIFDEYIKVKQHIRTVYGIDEKEWINARKQRLELESQLDALWVKTGHELEIRTLNDGDTIEPYETVMTIEGPLYQFVHLETIY
jgi:nicotinic acid phosphoribosyltransferase